MALNRTIVIVITFMTYPLFAFQNGTGLIMDDEVYQQAFVQNENTPDIYRLIPSQHSLKMYCPKPLNQMGLGTCVGWATNYGARTIMEAIHQNWTDKTKITQEAYSPSFVYSLIKKDFDEDCTFGANIGEALVSMKIIGSIPYTQFQEFCTSEIDPRLFSVSREHKIDDYIRLFDISEMDTIKVNRVRLALSSNYPIVVGMKCPRSFFEAKETWLPVEDPEAVQAGHSVVVVGYDDKRKIGVNTGGFEIMNSWGERWGDSGFTWISYRDFGAFVKYAYELWKVPPDKNFSAKLEIEMSNRRLLQARKINEEGYYSLSNKLKVGDSFRLLVSNNEAAYCYVIGTDDSLQPFQIFPTQDRSPLLGNLQNKFAIPSIDEVIEVVSPGTDYLFILYSRRPINISDLVTELAKKLADSKNFASSAYDVLGNFNVPWKTLRYFNDSSVVEGNFELPNVVIPLLFKIESVK